jgi:hypothetical protein
MRTHSSLHRRASCDKRHVERRLMKAQITRALKNKHQCTIVHTRARTHARRHAQYIDTHKEQRTSPYKHTLACTHCNTLTATHTYIGMTTIVVTYWLLKANCGHKHVMFCLLPMSLQVEVEMEGQMKICLNVCCLTVDCNRTNSVTSLYCTRLLSS